MNAQITTPATSYPLITRERTEKLELLSHLITNLARTVVICGPEGVGKTQLLKNFQETTMETWMFCWVKSNNQLNFEKIQKIIGDTIKQNMPDLKFQTLENVFDRMADWNMKIILVIDDGGHLAPGLIEQIISYVDGKGILRCIFALTHSELYLKGATDPAIENCYQIELPPLTEKQCGEFLEYLSTLSRPRIQYSAINEGMIANLYRESHGIPGKLLAQLPKADSKRKSDYSNIILGVAVVALIAAALGVQWWSTRQTIEREKVASADKNQKKNTKIQQPSVKPNADLAQAKQPEVASGAVVGNPIPQPSQVTGGTSTSEKPTLIANGVSIETAKIQLTQAGQPVGSVSASNNVGQPPVADASKSAEVSGTTNQNQVVPTLDEGGNWLMAQPVENITLQLMAISKEQTILEVMQRHQALGQNLKYLKTKTRNGKDRFVLLYGSFSSPELAALEGKNLPKELQKFWVRKMEAIQQELNPSVQPPKPEQ